MRLSSINYGVLRRRRCIPGTSRGVVSFEYLMLLAALVVAIVLAMPMARDWILSFGELTAYFVESPLLVFG